MAVSAWQRSRGLLLASVLQALARRARTPRNHTEASPPPHGRSRAVILVPAPSASQRLLACERPGRAASQQRRRRTTMLPQLTEQPARAATATRDLIGTNRGPAQWGADRRRGSREFTKPSSQLTRADAVEGRATKALRPPVDLADATHRAEVSLATASAITEKALLDYREARCRGAAWLWARATKRAGGSRTIVLFILHLWKNHTAEATAQRKHIEQIIGRYTLRRRRFLVREWRRVARIQRAERRAE